MKNNKVISTSKFIIIFTAFFTLSWLFLFGYEFSELAEKEHKQFDVELGRLLENELIHIYDMSQSLKILYVSSQQVSDKELALAVRNLSSKKKDFVQVRIFKIINNDNDDYITAKTIQPNNIKTKISKFQKLDNDKILIEENLDGTALYIFKALSDKKFLRMEIKKFAIERRIKNYSTGHFVKLFFHQIF